MPSVQSASAPATLAIEGAAHAAPRGSRRKLWDLPHKYHCPIIGTCLHVDILRRLAEKTRCRSNARLSDYEVHVSFVAAADKKNPLALATQKTLDRRYAASVRRFAAARSDDELQQAWQEAVASGEVPGAFWALMTHPRTGAAMMAWAYEEVHMLSHQFGAGLIGNARQVAEARAELARVTAQAEQDARRARAAIEERDRRLAALEERLARTRTLAVELEEARRCIARLEADGAAAGLREQLGRAETELAALRHQEARARGQAERWRERCETSDLSLKRAHAEAAHYRDLCTALEQLLQEEAPGECAAGSPEACRACPDLGGRRVLCIGGRSSLAVYYRSVVDRCNGQFVHHDGGLEDSRQRLEALIAAADVVVCPASCVSHDAYLRAKRYCKRTAKPCVLLKSAGIVSFTRALERVAS